MTSLTFDSGKEVENHGNPTTQNFPKHVHVLPKHYLHTCIIIKIDLPADLSTNQSLIGQVASR